MGQKNHPRIYSRGGRIRVNVEVTDIKRGMYADEALEELSPEQVPGSRLL